MGDQAYDKNDILTPAEWLTPELFVDHAGHFWRIENGKIIMDAKTDRLIKDYALAQHRRAPLWLREF